MPKNVSKFADEARTWATAHVIIAMGIAFAVGVIVGAVL